MSHNSSGAGESTLDALMAGNLHQIRLGPDVMREEVRQFYRHTWIMTAAQVATVGGLLASSLGG